MDSTGITAEQAPSFALTSTTAPGKVFATRAELADHYKSDWHKYNLKRREAGLPLLLEPDFMARVEAAQSLRRQAQEANGGGKGHLKNKKQQKKKNKGAQTNASSQVPAYDRLKQQQQLQQDNDHGVIIAQAGNGAHNPEEQMKHAPADTVVQPQQDDNQEDQMIHIDPHQCLFDSHMSASVQANVDRMYRKYGFFLPDREYLTDLTGLIGFCHEKIKLGHMCLYCQRVFATYNACQKHMISKRHTKLLYEAGVDLEDFTVFYDFTEADAEFLGKRAVRRSSQGENDDEKEEENEIGEDDNDGNWEDVSDDEQGLEEDEEGRLGDDDEDEPDEDEDYIGYEEEVARMGLDVTPLGEIIFPDGRIIGHRSLMRYYRQRLPQRNESTAVISARVAAGERLYRGQVYNIGYHGSQQGGSAQENALVLSKAGISPGLAAGRAGKGILVTGGSSHSYSQLSIYRFRAAIRKQRQGDKHGMRLHNKTNLNINRMDKKHNRLMNGVSVAHAAR